VKRFYVYELVDTLSGLAFYVGKGCGDRMSQHERDAKVGKRSKTCNRIRKIWRLGGEVQCVEVRRFAREDRAYRFEQALIKEIGLSRLTNITLGGVGAKSVTERELRRREIVALAGNPVFIRAVRWLLTCEPRSETVEHMVIRAARSATPLLLKEIQRCPGARVRFKEAMRGCSS